MLSSRAPSRPTVQIGVRWESFGGDIFRAVRLSHWSTSTEVGPFWIFVLPRPWPSSAPANHVRGVDELAAKGPKGTMAGNICCVALIHLFVAIAARPSTSLQPRPNRVPERSRANAILRVETIVDRRFDLRTSRSSCTSLPHVLLGFLSSTTQRDDGLPPPCAQYPSALSLSLFSHP